MADPLSRREAVEAAIARLRDLDLPGFRNNHNGFGLLAAAQNPAGRSGRPRRPLCAILAGCEPIGVFAQEVGGAREAAMVSCNDAQGRGLACRIGSGVHAAALLKRWATRTLLARANHRSTVVTLRRPRTVNW
jgi:hypothetical protein